MFIYTLPQPVVNKLLIMGIINFVLYELLHKICCFLSTQNIPNLQANFYAPFSMKISLSTHAHRSYLRISTKHSLGCGASRYFLESKSLCFAIRCLETSKFYSECSSIKWGSFNNEEKRCSLKTRFSIDTTTRIFRNSVIKQKVFWLFH